MRRTTGTLALILSLTTGCATLMNGGSQLVDVHVDPEQALASTTVTHLKDGTIYHETRRPRTSPSVDHRHSLEGRDDLPRNGNAFPPAVR